jgi:hypothetical protein
MRWVILRDRQALPKRAGLAGPIPSRSPNRLGQDQDQLAASGRAITMVAPRRAG